MSLSHSAEHPALTGESEDSSLVSLLQHGLHDLRQGHYTTGVAYLALAHEQLLPDQIPQAAVLDALTQSSANYWNAQQTLHKASKHFSECDGVQKAQIAALEKLLSTLMQETNAVHHAVDPPPTNSKSNGFQPLPQPSRKGDQSSTEQQTPSEDKTTLPELSITPPDAQYRGDENQLYRVEIHNGGFARDPTKESPTQNLQVVPRQWLRCLSHYQPTSIG